MAAMEAYGMCNIVGGIKKAYNGDPTGYVDILSGTFGLATDCSGLRSAFARAPSGAGDSFAEHRWGDPETRLCFPADAWVQTPTGVRKICELGYGDVVLSYDEERKCVVESKVTGLLKNWTLNLIKLIVGGETIWATRNHPVFVASRATYLLATQLEPGMTVLDKDLKPRVIESVACMATHEDTYNIEVARYHTYFVGEVGVLVHNMSFGNTTKFDAKICGIVDGASRKVVPVGKTTVGVMERFRQHITGAHTEWTQGYSPVILRSGKWTAYETAVWEQHFISANGGPGVLQNKINAISEASYRTYKATGQFNPCG